VVFVNAMLESYTRPMKNTIEIYTDGASRGNPGPGGWAAILILKDQAVELAGRKDGATNNQMELLGAEQALAYVCEHMPEGTVLLHVDSTYVLNGITRWVDGWERNGWITTAKKPVENKIQWQNLLKLRNQLGKRLELVKVAGHSGHVYNDRCDELAVASALNQKPALFSGTKEQYEAYLKAFPPKSVKKPASKTKSTAKAYSYVSSVGGKVYADKTWADCEKRVKGKAGAKYKKVYSKGEETSLLQDYTLSSLL
jgi:ribonuclease HI